MIHFQVFYLWWKKIWHSLYEWLITFLNSFALSLSRGSDNHTHTRTLSLSLSLVSLALSQGSLNHQLKGVADDKVFSTKGGKKISFKKWKGFQSGPSFFLSPTTLRHETKKKLITAKKYPEAKYWFSFDTMVLFNNVVFSTIPFSHQPGFSLLLSSSSPFQYFSPILVTFLCTQSHTLSHTHTPMHMHTHTQFLSQLVIWF